MGWVYIGFDEFDREAGLIWDLDRICSWNMTFYTSFLAYPREALPEMRCIIQEHPELHIVSTIGGLMVNREVPEGERFRLADGSRNPWLVWDMRAEQAAFEMEINEKGGLKASLYDLLRQMLLKGQGPSEP